jgi:hypothetical protein
MRHAVIADIKDVVCAVSIEKTAIIRNANFFIRKETSSLDKKTSSLDKKNVGTGETVFAKGQNTASFHTPTQKIVVDGVVEHIAASNAASKKSVGKKKKSVGTGQKVFVEWGETASFATPIMMIAMVIVVKQVAATTAASPAKTSCGGIVMVLSVLRVLIQKPFRTSTCAVTGNSMASVPSLRMDCVVSDTQSNIRVGAGTTWHLVGVDTVASVNTITHNFIVMEILAIFAIKQGL